MPWYLLVSCAAALVRGDTDLFLRQVFYLQVRPVPPHLPERSISDILVFFVPGYSLGLVTELHRIPIVSAMAEPHNAQ